jgi:PAS domain S-box-containing protein
MDRSNNTLMHQAEMAFGAHPWGIQVYQLDASGQAPRLLYANAAADRLLGAEGQAAQGLPLGRALPGEPGLAEVCLQALRKHRSGPLEELLWRDAEGSPRWLALTVFPCLGGCLGLMLEDATRRRAAQAAQEATARDLSAEVEQRRRSEQRLSQITAEWTAVFDSLPELVSVVDADFRLRRVNRALAEFVGCTAQELIGRKCHEVMHGRDEPWEGCPHTACLAAGHSVTRLVEDPAIGRPLMVTCSPHQHLPGHAGCSVHVARDVSEQRAAEAEREALIRDLQEALAKVHLLSGLIPICAWCKKVRDDSGYWEQLESYFRKHSHAEFSHGVCPDCAKAIQEDHRSER